MPRASPSRWCCSRCLQSSGCWFLVAKASCDAHNRRVRKAAALALLLLIPVAAAQQNEPPNALLLIAKPELQDPNFRETVVLVTQAADASTVGVILNRPTNLKNAKGEPLWFGGPVMREVTVALFRSERAPSAAAFPVLKGVYLSMHPANMDALSAGQRHRLYSGFSGWAPG